MSSRCRRPNAEAMTIVRAVQLEFYIVPRTGVFTTHTRLNTGLRLQRRPELNGDLERELHQNRAQLNAHPVSSVAVLRLRQQVVVTRAERASRTECPADHMAYGLSVVVAGSFCFCRNVCSQSNLILSGVLVTFRQQLAAEFASRNCAYTAAGPATA